MVITTSDIKHYELMAVLADKQLITEPIIKVVAITKQLTLEENLLKLCSELRDDGFDIYADSVEEKFLALKTADVHLYHVHDEDGEDLIEFAHPDGDHNVEDGELGDVETIVSQHKKMLEVVKKQPTGKLAQYVEMCRIVLAQGVQQQFEITRQQATAQQMASALKNIDADVQKTFGGLGTWMNSIGYNATLGKVFELLKKNQITKDDIGVIRSFLSQIKGRLAPGWSIYKPYLYDSGVSQDMWQQIENKFDSVISQVDTLDSERDEVLPMLGSQVGASAQKAKTLVDKLNAFQARIKLSTKITDQAVKDKYTQQIIDEIKEINTNVNNIDTLNILEKEVDGFIAKVSVNV